MFSTFESFATIARKKVVAGLTTISAHPTLATDIENYYKMDTNANDSVSAINGTATGATLTTGNGGQISEGYDFDGVNDYISLPSTGFDTTFSGDFSVSLWVNVDNFDPASFSESWMICFRGDRNVQMKYTAAGAFLINFFTGTNYTITTAGGYSTGVWYNVTATKSGTNGTKIYVNGVEQAANASATGTPSTNTAGSSIGDYAGSLTNYQVDGTIDEIGIWSKELTAEEVKNLYNNGAGLPYD